MHRRARGGFVEEPTSLREEWLAEARRKAEESEEELRKAAEFQARAERMLAEANAQVQEIALENAKARREVEVAQLSIEGRRPQRPIGGGPQWLIGGGLQESQEMSLAQTASVTLARQHIVENLDPSVDIGSVPLRWAGVGVPAGVGELRPARDVWSYRGTVVLVSQNPCGLVGEGADSIARQLHDDERFPEISWVAVLRQRDDREEIRFRECCKRGEVWVDETLGIYGALGSKNPVSRLMGYQGGLLMINHKGEVMWAHRRGHISYKELEAQLIACVGGEVVDARRKSGGITGAFRSVAAGLKGIFELARSKFGPKQITG